MPSHELLDLRCHYMF